MGKSRIGTFFSKTTREKEEETKVELYNFNRPEFLTNTLTSPEDPRDFLVSTLLDKDIGRTDPYQVHTL